MKVEKHYIKNNKSTTQAVEGKVHARELHVVSSEIHDS
jgi:hypothetical protein